MNQRLPIFVYGTLRTDQGNWRWALAGNTVSEVHGTVAGMVMHDNGAFPFAYPTSDPADVIHGDLMHVKPDLYDKVLGSLDSLEGYKGPGRFNLYERGIVPVTLDDGTIEQAYAYYASHDYYANHVRRLPRVTSGDWLIHEANRAPGRRYVDF